VFTAEETQPVTEETFRSQLGQAGVDLLAQGVRSLEDSINRLEPDLLGIAVGRE
jgi:hypothetical protein